MAAHQAPPIPGILQARTLEWVAISFSKVFNRKLDIGEFKNRPTWDFPGKWASEARHGQERQV